MAPTTHKQGNQNGHAQNTMSMGATPKPHVAPKHRTRSEPSPEPGVSPEQSQESALSTA